MKSNKARKRPFVPAPGQVIQVVAPLPGVEDQSCSCPICAALAHAGEPVYELGADGNLYERILEPPPMMEVVVVPRGKARDFLGSKKRPTQVPVGCSVLDLLGYLKFRLLPNDRRRCFVPTGESAQHLTPLTTLEGGARIEVDVATIDLGTGLGRLA